MHGCDLPLSMHLQLRGLLYAHCPRRGHSRARRARALRRRRLLAAAAAALLHAAGACARAAAAAAEERRHQRQQQQQGRAHHAVNKRLDHNGVGVPAEREGLGVA